MHTDSMLCAQRVSKTNKKHYKKKLMIAMAPQWSYLEKKNSLMKCVYEWKEKKKKKHRRL